MSSTMHMDVASAPDAVPTPLSMPAEHCDTPIEHAPAQPIQQQEQQEQQPSQSSQLDQAKADQRVLTPPTSDDAGKRQELDSSDLSDLDMDDDEDEDIGDIEPAEYWDDGRIPIFRPTMTQFRDFQKFIQKIDKYGMKSGIVKVVPPQEWRESLSDLSEQAKMIRIKNPIKQEFAGTHGTYTQANIEKQRSYSLPQWKTLNGESNHQPPAPRGERRKTVLTTTPKPKPERPSSISSTPASKNSTPQEKRGRGRPRKHAVPTPEVLPSIENEQNIPPTPTSPHATIEEPQVETSEVKEIPAEIETPVKRGRGRPPKSTLTKAKSTPKSTPKVKVKKEKPDNVTSVASRRMNNKREQTCEVDEAAFKGFDYHMKDVTQFTKERCRELEEHYWKTINYGTPMYGADMPGSLFSEDLNCWNVAKLPNLLDVLGTKVPGVNTAYLYLGMWKATFAWHLEDVDLYSINYIHFGAPKQWYSISQEDARRFEAAMKSIWPNDAKHCDQFLRHKTYLISPEKLKSQFNITVNKLVHYEGEFVITYPYGYHSGFNIGYNCAESVNFANETWLNYGRIAKKCYCEADSVWVDVYEIERKLRGEPTPEYVEYTEDEDDLDDVDQLPSPPASIVMKKKRGRKRKREEKSKEGPGRKAKRVKIRVRVPTREPCILCPNDPKYDILLPTDNGKMAHRQCAIYTPETYLAEENGREKVFNVAGIDKARLELKCNYCRSKRGSVFQCSSRKCARAYHATCAAAAGVQIDTGLVPTWGEDGTEYYCEGYDFRCRFHRPKRPKTVDSQSLEKNSLVSAYGNGLKPGDVIQALYLDGDIFGGLVIENRPGEGTCLVEVLPDGDQVEVEWKWLLVLDPEQSERPKPSPEAKPLPQHLLKSEVSITNRKDGVPEIGDPFQDPIAGQKWAEFHKATTVEIRNLDQVKVDINKPEGVWHYLGKTSTEARAQYTHDVLITTHNLRSNFLDTVKPLPAPIVPRQPLPVTYPSGARFPIDLSGPNRSQKPYIYKPRIPSQHQQLQSIYAQGLPWQQGIQNLAPRPPASQHSTDQHETSARNVSGGHQAQYQLTQGPKQPHLAQSPGMPSHNSGSYANPSQQELLKKDIPGAIGNSTSLPSASLPKRDNSPRYQNFYAQAESRYSSQAPLEFSRRYEALAQAIQPTHASLQANLAVPITSLQNAHAPSPSSNGNHSQPTPPNPTFAQHSAALESLRTLTPDLHHQSLVPANQPFTPPSQRPELRAALESFTAENIKPRPLQKQRSQTPPGNPTPESIALLNPALQQRLGQSSWSTPSTSSSPSSRLLPVMHQSSEQFEAQLHKEQQRARPNGLGTAAAMMGGLARFESLIRQLGNVGGPPKPVAQTSRPSSFFPLGERGRTPPPPPSPSLSSMRPDREDLKAAVEGTPERPQYSPILERCLPVLPDVDLDVNLQVDRQ